MSTSKREWARAKAIARRALAEMTDEEDAAITADAMMDPDLPPLSDEMLARLRPSVEVAPDFVAAMERRRRGRGKKPAKLAVTLRLAPETLERFRAGGPGWQTRIDEALKRFIAEHPEEV